MKAYLGSGLDLFDHSIPRKGEERDNGYMSSLISIIQMQREEEARIAKESPVQVSEKQHNEVKASNGMKEFIIDGVSVWALNYKNAVRKYNKPK